VEGLVTFTSVAALGATIYTAVNLLKYLRAGNWNGVVTLVAACLVGIGVVWLAAQADVTENLTLIEDGAPLGLLDGWSLVLAGIALASLSSAFTDIRKAIDGTASAEKPALIPPPHG
jgi:hypothetical protein